MKLKLKSDFRDYYDHAFDLDGEIFQRMSTGGMSRREMFAYLQAQGFIVPDHGIVQQMPEYEKELDDTMIVVYTDEQAHRGEGKYLCSVSQALKRFPTCFYSDYIVGFYLPVSYRHLQIGNRAWTMMYRSDDLWRSNCGNVEIVNIKEVPAHLPIQYLLFATDSIICKRTGIAYTIDFNIAPGIKGTGLEDILKPTEVVDLIKQWITLNR